MILTPLRNLEAYFFKQTIIVEETANKKKKMKFK
jgi:hypothetical protein